MDQAGNFTLVFALDRHDIAVAAQRDDRVAQILGKARRGDDLLQRILDLCALDAHMAADIRQLAAGCVGDLLLGENGIRDLLLKIATVSYTHLLQLLTQALVLALEQKDGLLQPRVIVRLLHAGPAPAVAALHLICLLYTSRCV